MYFILLNGTKYREAYNTWGDNTYTWTIAKNEYDELGQLKMKYQGYSDNSIDDGSPSYYWNGLSYEYNIRGWLKSINKDFVNDTPTPNFSLFGEVLSYDYGFSANQFTGNIAGIKWKSYGDKEVRAYGYEYG
jgi:hypothetical protein